MTFFDKVKARWAEPSTRNGIGIVITSVAPFVPYPYSWILIGAAAAFGIRGITLPEQPKKE